MRLHNKVAIITGGSRGMDFAAADRFPWEGAAVIPAATTREPADQAVARLKQKHPRITDAGPGHAVPDRL